MDVFIVDPSGNKINAVAIVFPDGGILPTDGEYIYTAPHAPLWKLRTKLWTKVGATVTVYLITDTTTQTSDSFITGGS